MAGINVDSLIGTHPLLEAVRDKLGKASFSRATLLIRGETGTGKDLAARIVGALSIEVNKGRFVALNVAEFPESLLEAELFGHEKGAFTGANGRRIGKFEYAHGGTLFIDEIADIPLHIQTKLLRVLSNKSITRLGGNDVVRTDFRLICATNKNLEKMVEDGTFREDLYHRINVLSVTMPPLRMMPSVIPEAAKIIAVGIRIDNEERPDVEFTKACVNKLKKYSWPGNFRELTSAMERMVTDNYKKTIIDADDVELNGKIIANRIVDYSDSFLKMLEPHFEEMIIENPLNAYSIVDSFGLSVIKLALKKANGNQVEASKMLGISRNTLRKRISKTHNIGAKNAV